MSYLDLLKKVGPTPQEIKAKQKEEEREAAEQRKLLEKGAKTEIADLQERAAELKADPSKTSYQPMECCGPSYYDDMKWKKEEFRCAVHDVAKILADNAEDESEAISGYTDQLQKLECLLKTTQCCIESLAEKKENPQGPEDPKKDRHVSVKLDYFNKVAAWTAKTIASTQEKIQDELNHNSSLLAEYIAFTGITPSPDGMKEVAKTIGSAPAARSSNDKT